MVNKIFNNQLRRIIDGYVDDMLVKSMVVDDMLVKSMTFKQYFLYLKEVFFLYLSIIRWNLMFPKYIFAIKWEKFLGFIVSNKGIKLNP